MSIEYASLPGETTPPIPEGPKLCTGDEMRVLHNAFFWGYQQAPGLVRSVAPADTKRSGVVGQWLADLDATLHVHHEGEDQLLWDKLSTRAPACALHVEQMRAQHSQVAELLAVSGPLLAEWTTSADPQQREQLAVAYERMLAVLLVHLRWEVVEMVPVAEKVVTQREWSELGKHGVGAVPKSRLLPQLGLLLACSSPADRAYFFASLPVPVKVLWRLTGRRQFAKQYRELFPGQPVPETL